MRKSNDVNDINHEIDRADTKRWGFKTLATLCLLLSCTQTWSDIESDKRIRELEQRIAVLEAALGVTANGKLNPRNIELNISQSADIDSGKNLQLEAGDQILLKVGKAQIRMNKSGLVEIRGSQISAKQNQQELFVKGNKINDN